MSEKPRLPPPHPTCAKCGAPVPPLWVPLDFIPEETIRLCDDCAPPGKAGFFLIKPPPLEDNKK